MKWLELKIPPAIVVAICVLISALARQYEVGLFKPTKQWDIWVGLSLATAVVVLVSGIVGFKKAQTTVDPTHPESASSLVTQGIYSYSRNPMYLAMTLLLISTALYLGTWIGFVCTLGFVGYITQFQIKPEERMMAKLFGQEYLDYKTAVRRWL